MIINQRKAGIVLSYLGQVVQILTALIYTPIMLRLLGKSEYGLYQLVNSVVSYLGLLSLGFGASYMRFYSRAKAESDEKQIAKINGMFFIIFSILSLICILCGSIMVINIEAVFANGLTSSEYVTARILMIILVVNLALTFPNTVFNCIITSQEKFFYQKLIVLIQYVLNPIIALPLLLAGYGSIGMVLVTTFITIGGFLCNVIYSKIIIKAKFSFCNFDFSLLKEMWIFTFFIFINQIVDQINWSVDKLLLGRMIGTTAVAVYGIGGQINALYLQLSSTVSSVFIPKVNRIVAEQRSEEELTDIFTKVGRIQFIIIFLVLSGFYFFGKPFIKFWAGDGYEDAYIVALLLLTPVTVPLIQNIGIEIQRAKNKHKARSIVYFFIAILNILISIPLIRYTGMVGAAIGTTISLTLGNVLFMNWYYYKKIGINIFYFWKNIISFFPSLMIPVVFGFIIDRVVSYENVITLLFSIVAYTFVYSIAVYKFGLNTSEKKEIILVKRK